MTALSSVVFAEGRQGLWFLLTKQGRFVKLEIGRRLLNTFRSRPQRKVFFLHFPKAAGTSISNALLDRYVGLDFVDKRACFDLHSEAASRAATLLSADSQKNPYGFGPDKVIWENREHILSYLMSCERYRLISGHFPFSANAAREFHGEYLFVTCLRNPAERLTSAFFFNENRADGYCKTGAEIDEYLASDVAAYEGAAYVRQLQGTPEERARDPRDRRSIERAKANLETFDVLGQVERLQELARDLSSKLGVTLKIPRSNVNPVSRDRISEVMTAERRERIASLCEPDSEVYEYSLKLAT